jgi:hypothetical protein
MIDKHSFEDSSCLNNAKISYIIKNLNSLLSLILIKKDIKIPFYNKANLINAVKKDIKGYMDATNISIHEALNNDQLLVELKHMYTVMKLFLLAN